jgi:cystathionine beta-lyase
MATKKPDLATALIHHPYVPPPGFAAPQPAVHKASTVIFPDTAALRARNWKSKAGYTYGLHGTPGTFTLEERIATLEGGLQTLLLPSGLAAIALVDMALLKSGDEVLIPDNAYGPGKELARNELAGWGVKHRFYDAMEPASLAAAIGPATKLVWLEAPGSVTMEFPDLPALLRIARERGVSTALDNTWGAGIAFDAFDLDGGQGVDICMQALTKYPSGGGDVLMGSVTTRDEALHLKLKFTHMRMGWGVGGNDVEALLRSLPSLPLRYAAHDASARTLAQWWAGRGEVVQVLHPALPGSPGHAHWKTLCRAAGRCLRRCTAAVQARLLMGRASEPGGPLRPGDDARETGLEGHAGALLDRAGSGRRPDRRLRPSAADLRLCLKPCAASSGPSRGPSPSAFRCGACRVRPCPWPARARPSRGRPCSAGPAAPG